MMEDLLKVGYLGSAESYFTKIFLSKLSVLELKSLYFIELKQVPFKLEPQKQGFIFKIVRWYIKKREDLNYSFLKLKMKNYCKQKQIKFLSIQSFEEIGIQSLISELDILFTAGIRTKIPNALINLPKFGIINFHYSLLPKYRGTNPLFWQSVYEDDNYGFSFHKIDENFDRGNLIFKKEIGIPSELKSPGSKGDFIIRQAANYLSEIILRHLNLGQLSSYNKIYTNSDYFEYVQIDKSSFSEELLTKTKHSKILIFEKEFYLHVVKTEKMHRLDSIIIKECQLVMVKNNIALFIKRINYIPAIFYYIKFKSKWNKSLE